MNLYCVGTPFQLVSAIEARHHFPADHNVLVIRDTAERREEHRSQVQNLSTQSEWDEIIYWPVHRGKRLTRLWQQARFTRRLAAQFSDPLQTYLMAGFSQVKNHLLRGALKPQHTILLDDGVGTLAHYRKHLSPGQYHPDWMAERHILGKLQQRLEFRICGSSMLTLQQPMDLFTCFSLPQVDSPTQIHHHAFEGLLKSRGPQQIDVDRVDYFGSPLAERGILALEVEVEMISGIHSHYVEQSLRFCYVAHRDDSSEKLEALEKLGIKTKRLEMPAEFYYINTDRLPGTFASTISTALHNLHVIFPDIQADLFQLPFDEMLKRSEQAENATLQYQSTGIRTVKLLK